MQNVKNDQRHAERNVSRDKWTENIDREKKRARMAWSSVTQLSMELHFGKKTALSYKREPIFKKKKNSLQESVTPIKDLLS